MDLFAVVRLRQGQRTDNLCQLLFDNGFAECTITPDPSLISWSPIPACQAYDHVHNHTTCPPSTMPQLRDAAIWDDSLAPGNPGGSRSGAESESPQSNAAQVNVKSEIRDPDEIYPPIVDVPPSSLGIPEKKGPGRPRKSAGPHFHKSTKTNPRVPRVYTPSSPVVEEITREEKKRRHEQAVQKREERVARVEEAQITPTQKRREKKEEAAKETTVKEEVPSVLDVVSPSPTKRGPGRPKKIKENLDPDLDPNFLWPPPVDVKDEKVVAKEEEECDRKKERRAPRVSMSSDDDHAPLSSFVAGGGEEVRGAKAVSKLVVLPFHSPRTNAGGEASFSVAASLVSQPIPVLSAASHIIKKKVPTYSLNGKRLGRPPKNPNAYVTEGESTADESSSSSTSDKQNKAKGLIRKALKSIGVTRKPVTNDFAVSSPKRLSRKSVVNVEMAGEGESSGSVAPAAPSATESPRSPATRGGSRSPVKIGTPTPSSSSSSAAAAPPATPKDKLIRVVHSNVSAGSPGPSTSGVSGTATSETGEIKKKKLGRPRKRPLTPPPVIDKFGSPLRMNGIAESDDEDKPLMKFRKGEPTKDDDSWKCQDSKCEQSFNDRAKYVEHVAKTHPDIAVGHLAIPQPFK